MKKTFILDYPATTYLRKKFGAGNLFNQGLGAISAKKDLQLKCRLIEKESYQTLATIHSGIEAKYEFMKQIGLLLTILLFSLTTMIGGLSMYVQQAMKNNDWTHETIMLDVKAQADLLETREWLKDPVDLYNAKNKLYTDSLSEQKKSYSSELFKFFDQYHFVMMVLIMMVTLILYSIICRYMWISSIHFCVKEAYKQKEKIENQTS